MKLKKLLIIGDMTLGSNSRSLADGFRECDLEVVCIDTSRLLRSSPGGIDWLSSHLVGRASKRSSSKLRSEILNALNHFNADAMLVIKGVAFDQSVFLDAHVPIKVHISFDDVSNPDNISEGYLTRESEWDSIVTTKLHNIDELKSRGASNIVHIMGAYDPRFSIKTLDWHNRSKKIAFIGAARPDRKTLPHDLATIAYDESFCIGPKWNRYYPRGLPGVFIGPGQFGSEFLSFGSDVKVGLLLLNSENRDTHTMRSYELPALGQAVVVEKSFEHELLYRDGHSGLLFSDKDQMIDQARYLCQNDDFAEKLASKAFTEIANDRNTYHARALEILTALESEM